MLDTDDYSLDDVCARELSVLFSHFVQETGARWSEWRSQQEGIPFWRQALYHVTEMDCTEGTGWGHGSQRCDYAQTWDSWARTDYPPQTGV